MMRDRAIAQRVNSSVDSGHALMFASSGFGFLCLPFPAIYLVGIIGSLSKRSASLVLAPMVIFGSIFLALVASTKIVDGDLIIYLATFSSAPKLELDSFLLIQGKDPLYYSFVYLISKTGLVSGSGFVFVSVLLSYLLILWGTVRGARFLQISPDKILLAIILLIYFGPLFSNSAHLLRQFLAGAVVLFAFACHPQNWKVRWFLVVMASLIHSSAILFLLVLLSQVILGGGRRRGTVGRLLFVMCSLLIVRFAAASLSMISNSMGLDTVSYAIGRLSQNQFFGLAPLNTASLWYVIVLSVAAFWVSSQQGAGKGGSMTPNHFVEPILITATIILVSHLLGFHELSIRYMIYLYIFSGIIFACFLARIQMRSAPILPILALILPIFFVIGVDSGVWTYAPTRQIMFGNFYSFIR